MFWTSTAPLLAIGVLSFVWSLHAYRDLLRRHRGHSLPPGPMKLPLIGNLLDFSRSPQPWKLYFEWADRYGGIVYLKFLSTPIILLSSRRVAFDLLEKRSSIYSDRPPSTMDELTGTNWNFSFMRYGPRWRETRRFFHQHFNQNAASKFRDTQIQHIRAFVGQAYDSKGDITLSKIRQMLASTIVDVVYGMQIDGMDCEFVQVAETALGVVLETRIPGAFWAEHAPFLKYIPAWIPGIKAQRYAARVRPIVMKARDMGYDFVQSTTNPKSCMALDLISQIQSISTEDQEEKEQRAREATGVAYAASIDTTLSLLSFFFTQILRHPEIQAKAHMELDKVVGPYRLPEYGDCESLPYIQAIFMECARWEPAAPLGLPHRTTEDDYYDGYFIPKGAVIWANLWTMMHNPDEYPNPEQFCPERFLRDDGRIDTSVQDPTTLLFGFGRRVCPGRHFAKDNAWMTIATVLHLFHVRSSIDEHGKPIEIPLEPDYGLLSYPKQTACTLVPRSEAAEKLLRS